MVLSVYPITCWQTKKGKCYPKVWAVTPLQDQQYPAFLNVTKIHET